MLPSNLAGSFVVLTVIGIFIRPIICQKIIIIYKHILATMEQVTQVTNNTGPINHV